MADEVAVEVVEKENKFKAEVEAENAKLTGIGLRWFYGSTRGRGTQEIKWQAFDTDKPETLPTSVPNLTEIIGITDAKKLLSFLIDGVNDYLYRQASDPIAEYVNPAWDDETKLKFRTIVRNYSSSAEVSIEDTVALMKPGIEKVFAAKQAAIAAATPVAQ
jgi:hypothetical protein